MKKVGLITYYGENYGGMLQAYALQQYVQNLNFDCQIISNDFLYVPNKKQWHSQLLRNLKSLLHNPSSYLQKRKIIRSFAGISAKKSEKFGEFLRQYISLDHNGYACYQQFLDNPPAYDIYLCGSDQIWNPNLYHDNGFYFAGFAPENALKIAYASSIGVSHITNAQAAFMKPFLSRMDCISTRETDGSAIAEKLTGKQVRTVIDPTLLLNAEQWSKVAAKPLIQEPYIFCYFFGERNYYENIKQQVKEMTGYQLVSIPFVARDFASDDEKIYDAGPAEFISLIQNAKLVITDSFHATAFSINLKTPFLSLCRFAKNDSMGMNSRLHTILGALELTDRLVDENDTITEDMLFAVDFEKAHRHLDRLRVEDGQFLKNSLNIEK